MNLIIALALSGLALFVLVVVIVGIVEFFVESREESAFITKQDEWNKKASNEPLHMKPLRRANENKPK